ncbi:SAM-dependent methyltransferase [Streptomyces sp. OfavH-34-F]|uniref:SAM-dependent methyltransferase n=1 Tax=unclassified Streptomyces TaxID=2593676 RepID=UPI001EF22F1E|nr:SAM-dependent methyltransferase [Streptomyces sp. OfavH-34-F]MCG7528612.1 SAM-dependent methyltransferase [Streptomyces sp. OfavH-34-F]
MTPTLVRHHRPTESSAAADGASRARDWTEIQERMLAPLYEAVYTRLEVGPATRMLPLGSGTGLALRMAADRGARIAGTPDAGPPNLIAALTPIGCEPGDGEELIRALEAAVPSAERGSAVVLTGWGPPERCTSEAVLRVAGRLGDEGRGPRRDDLEDVAFRSGLRPDGSGRVACPFGYADMDGAVRGLLSTRLFRAAIRAADRRRVERELADALLPYRRADGSVRMSNVFRYLICTT